MGWEEAARDINLSEYRNWTDPERIVANVFSLYRQWGTVVHRPRTAAACSARWAAITSNMTAHAGECGHAH